MLVLSLRGRWFHPNLVGRRFSNRDPSFAQVELERIVVVSFDDAQFHTRPNAYFVKELQQLRVSLIETRYGVGCTFDGF
jgi:hypothetical protein